MDFNRVFHEINHPFWGFSPYFWKHPYKGLIRLFKLKKTVISEGGMFGEGRLTIAIIYMLF